MLTFKHLAVIKAALKYLDEEITPNGNEALTNYLSREDENLGVAIEHIHQARHFFDTADLNYALVDAAGLHIESQRLLPANQHATQDLHSDRSLIATVLVPVDIQIQMS